jgi:fido (protein-threonine AMPylation protein)
MSYSFYSCYAVRTPDPSFNNPHRYNSGAAVNKYGIEALDLLQSVQTNQVKPRLEALHDHIQFSEVNTSLLKNINQYLFAQIYGMAGKIRTNNAWVLPEKFFIPGLAVRHSDPKEINPELKAVLCELKKTDWAKLPKDEQYEKLAILLAKIWIIHPLIVGNTETILGLLDLFCHQKGWNINMTALINLLNRPIISETTEGLCLRDMMVGVWLSLYDEQEAQKDPSYNCEVPGPKKYLIDTLKENVEIK